MLTNISKMLCSRLYKRDKKKYFNNLDLNKISDNRVFWKSMKPLLSNKGINTTRNYLINDKEMTTKNMNLQIL